MQEDSTSPLQSDESPTRGFWYSVADRQACGIDSDPVNPLPGILKGFSFSDTCGMCGMADRFSKVRSRIMSSIMGKDASPEIKIRRLLWASGKRYKTHDTTVTGYPDISNKSKNLAVFRQVLLVQLRAALQGAKNKHSVLEEQDRKKQKKKACRPQDAPKRRGHCTSVLGD